MSSSGTTAELYLEKAGNMFVSLDVKGNIVLINRKGLEILEYDSDSELIGENWFSLFIPEEKEDEMRQFFNRIISNNSKNSEHYENEIVTRTAKRKIISWDYSVIKNVEDNTRYILGSGSDVTELREV